MWDVLLLLIATVSGAAVGEVEEESVAESVAALAGAFRRLVGLRMSLISVALIRP